MSPRNVDSVFASLKDFQRHTVHHVLNRLYDAGDSTGRFLVADEVGMGKTLVARGVIAGAIERLDRDPSVDRIDIIYICSNSAIAKQNIGKLDVLGTGSKPLNTRITMLASQAKDLNAKNPGHKTVNVIAITPGTSFDRGFARGKVEERVLIFEMLKGLFPQDLRALRCLLRLDVSQRSWTYHSERLASMVTVDADISTRFAKSIRKSSLWDDLSGWVEFLQGRSQIPKGEVRAASRTIGALRTALAKVSIDALEPDLVILDEFQRFKHLLEVPATDDDDDDIRRLAQQLFNYPDVRVLLLSATPYKLFTVAGEEGISGDDHYKDFLATTRFLVRDNEPEVRRIESAFTEYRRALIDGVDLESSREKAQTCLRRVMSRTERPTIGESRMGEELAGALGSPTGDEVIGYAAMDHLAMELGTTLPVDYWKSAPYFLNFMDGYKIGERFKSAIEEGGRPAIPKHAQVISPHQIARRQAVDPGNARLRELQRDLIDSGLWRLLWLPPSLPYLKAGGVYSGVNRVASTKRLIFSSWAAAPNSIAALLSHEISRRVFEGLDEDSNPFERSARLEFRTGEDLGQGLTTLALVTPIPGLARLVDSLDFVRANSGEPVSLPAILEEATELVRPYIPSPNAGQLRASRESWYWAVPFRFLDAEDELRVLLESDSEDESTSDEPTSRRAVLERIASVGEVKLGAAPDDVAASVAMLGMFGPGNIAYRALKKVLDAIAPSESVLIRAAVIVGEGFRSLFNRPESMALVDRAHPETEGPYWRRVLAYCADGDLQAVMDEYLHHLVGNSNPQSEQDVLELASMVRDSMSLKGSTVHLFNPNSPEKGFNVSTRFAVRYGSARGQDKSDEKSENRMSAVQQAFNSPFWPMVLASTSVGQEGVDFHWWCHSLVHWNLPSNPVDLEQREGRIHRFSGHAVRKNVATAFGSEALRSDDVNPWAALFRTAVEARSSEVTEAIGDLWPWWVFPGDAKIQTWTPALPFSKDIERDLRMRRLREIYRLAFGQPRQEDLLSLLDIKAANTAPLDLRPPKSEVT